VTVGLEDRSWPARRAGVFTALGLVAGLALSPAAAAAPPTPGWSAPRVLARSAAEYSPPRVAVAGGNAVVAWSYRRLRMPAAPQVLQLSERRGRAGAWIRRPGIRLPASAFAPAAVRTNARGDVAILVVAGSGEAARLLAVTRPGARGRWSVSAVARVSSLTYTLLALDGAGRVTAAWVQRRAGGPFVVRVARSAVGRAAWLLSSDVLRVQPNPFVGIDTGPALSLNDRGQLLAGWREPAGLGTRLLSAMRAPGKHWRAPQLIAESDTNGFAPSLALSPGGSAIAGWSGAFSAVSAKMVALRPREGSAWGPAETVGSGDGGGPFVALSDRGDALAMWGTGQETTQLIHILAAVRRPGQGWPAPTLLHTRDTGGSPIFVSVPGGAVANDGSAFVFISEEERASPGATLAALHTPAGGQWSVQGILQRDGPVPAVDSDGSAAVAWGNTDGPIEVMDYTPPATAP
jgi:hypothetical protein